MTQRIGVEAVFSLAEWTPYVTTYTSDLTKISTATSAAAQSVETSSSRMSVVTSAITSMDNALKAVEKTVTGLAGPVGTVSSIFSTFTNFVGGATNSVKSLASSVISAINPFNYFGSVLQIVTGIQISNFLDRIAQGLRNIAANALTATADTQRFVAWLQGALATEIARGTPVQREVPIEMTAEEEAQYQELLKKRVAIQNKIAIANKKTSEQQQDNTEAETERIKEQYRWQMRLEDLWDDMKDAVGSRDAIRALKIRRQIERTEKERDMALADQDKRSRKSGDIAESTLMRQTEQMRLYQEQLDEVNQSMQQLSGRTRIATVYEDPVEITQAYQQAAGQVDELFNKLRDVTFATRLYGRTTVEESFKSAVAYGFATDEALSLTRGLTKVGAAQGVGADQLERWAYNIAQARRYNKFYERDLRDLATSGFRFDQFLVAISKHTGKSIKTTEDLNDAISAGIITWDDVTKSVEQWGESQDFIVANMRRTMPAVQAGWQSLLSYIGPDVLGKSATVVAGILDRVLTLLEQMQTRGDFKKIGEELGKMVENWLTPLTAEGGLISRVEKWFSEGGAGGISGLVKAVFGTDNIDLGTLASGLITKVVSALQGAVGIAAPSIGALGRSIWDAIMGSPGKPGILQKVAQGAYDMLREFESYISGPVGTAQIEAIGKSITITMLNAMQWVVEHTDEIANLVHALSVVFLNLSGEIIIIGAQIGSSLAEGMVKGFVEKLGIDTNSPLFGMFLGAIGASGKGIGDIGPELQNQGLNPSILPGTLGGWSAQGLFNLFSPSTAVAGGASSTMNVNLVVDVNGSLTEAERAKLRGEVMNSAFRAVKQILVESE